MNRTNTCSGFTLVEVLLAVVLLALLATAFSTVYSSGFQTLDVQIDRMLLDSRLRSRMEYLMGTPFDTFGDSMESMENVTVNGNNYQITWTVVPIDLDGDSNDEVTARQVTVSLSAGGPGENDNLDRVVENNGDDAEEDDEGIMSLANGTINLGQMRYVGVRFVNVTIPQGANLIDAYVQFRAGDSNTEYTDLAILGEYTDNAAGFGTSANDISSRTQTTASVMWNYVRNWTANQSYQTPSIISIIQEIVDRPSWSSGNAITLLFKSTDLNGKRFAVSHDHPSANAPPLLHVEYSEGSPGPAFRSLTTIVVDNEGQVGKIS